MQLNTSREKTQNYERQYSDVCIILDDLSKGVEQVVSNLQKISDLKPNYPEQVTILDDISDDDTPRLSRQKRNEKLRSLISFALPNDSLVSQDIVDDNLIRFLGIIEQKANDLLTLNFIVNSSRRVTQLPNDSDSIIFPAGGVAGLLGLGPVAQIGLQSILAPSTGYSYD